MLVGGRTYKSATVGQYTWNRRIVSGNAASPPLNTPKTTGKKTIPSSSLRARVLGHSVSVIYEDLAKSSEISRRQQLHSFPSAWMIVLSHSCPTKICLSSHLSHGRSRVFR